MSAPITPGPLARREARLAWSLLSPTLLAVALVVVLPLLAVFWISFKPVGLSDLHVPAPRVYERLRGSLEQPGDTALIEYRLTNPSPNQGIGEVIMRDTLPAGMDFGELDPRCEAASGQLRCALGDWPAKHRERLKLPVLATQAWAEAPDLRAEPATISGQVRSPLLDSEWTLDNFRRIFDSAQFGDVLFATFFYTVVGTIGALLVGMFAALILDTSFRGQGALRGLLLFPYVAPVIAVAFTWVTLFDPFSGSLNALLLKMQLIDAPINFFGERGLALVMVTVFEIWRYFPLSFLFILARMQSIDTDMYEAADMDGASPLQKFWYLSMPQLLGILSILFLLRFIWTFNKFDDIFLLTGGNAGTRTLTVDVYEQAFAVSNIGAGAAVAVVVFGVLLVFLLLFFRFLSQEEGA